jgi:hypothetical protein
MTCDGARVQVAGVCARKVETVAWKPRPRGSWHMTGLRMLVHVWYNLAVKLFFGVHAANMCAPQLYAGLHACV